MFSRKTREPGIELGEWRSKSLRTLASEFARKDALGYIGSAPERVPGLEVGSELTSEESAPMASITGGK